MYLYNLRMKRPLLVIAMVASFLVFPLGLVSIAAETAVEINDFGEDEIAISIHNNIIHVTGANGQMMYVYNVAGIRVAAIKVEGNDKQYSLNLARGCYIIKIGKTVRKVSFS